MDVTESLVERFLCQNKLFLCPQYALGDQMRWAASVDSVVLDSEEQGVTAVEVCDSGDLGSVETKAVAVRDHGYFGRLEQQVAQQTRGATNGWKILFLGFVRNDSLACQARRKFPDDRFHFRPIKDTIEDWWSARELGLLPGRPS